MSVLVLNAELTLRIQMRLLKKNCMEWRGGYRSFNQQPESTEVICLRLQVEYRPQQECPPSL